MKIAVAGMALMAVVLGGCSSQAGPFVTNVSSNGAGSIIVEKCMVNLNRAINTVEAANCTNFPIQVQAPSSTR